MSGSRTRSVDFEDPRVVANSTAGKPGLDVLRDQLAGTAPVGPIQVTLGFRLLETHDGFAKLELPLGDHLYHSNGSVHSGVLATLLEAAMSSAVLSTLDAATVSTTSALAVHFTRAITSRNSKMVADGWVVHRGSRLVTAEGRLNDEQGRLVAHGSITCALSERSSASV
jgi:uncharacterized protein (TIGR00369 family)